MQNLKKKNLVSIEILKLLCAPPSFLENLIDLLTHMILNFKSIDFIKKHFIAFHSITNNAQLIFFNVSSTKILS